MIRTYDTPFSEPRTLFLPTGQVISTYLEKCGADPTVSLVVLNGAVVPKVEWSTRTLTEGDDLIVRPLLAGRTGKAILRIAVLAAVVIASYGVGTALLAAGHPILAALAVGGIAAAGAAITTFALGPPKPHQQQETPTYSWDGAHTIARQGGAISKQYGKFINAGNVIASYLESIKDKQYLNMLISLGWGPAKTLHAIKVNKNDISNYPEAYYTFNLGKNVQPVLQNFNRIVNTNSVNVRIRTGDAGYIINGLRSDTEAMEIEFLCPKGLWWGPDEDGDYQPTVVLGKVEYKKHTDTNWTEVDLAPVAVTPISNEPYWIAVKPDPNDPTRLLVMAETTDPLAHYEGEVYHNDTQQYLTQVPDGNGGWETIYTTKHDDGVWQKNPAYTGPEPTTTPEPGVDIVTVDTWSETSFNFSDNKPSPARFVHNLRFPEAAQWDVRITKTGSVTKSWLPEANQVANHEDNTKVGEELWVNCTREIAFDELQYPNEVLLALRVCATDKISGAGLDITCIPEMDVPETQGYKWMVKADEPSLYHRFKETSVVDVYDEFKGIKLGAYTAAATVGKPSLVNNATADYSVYGDGTGYVFNFDAGTAFPLTYHPGKFFAECLVRPETTGRLFETFDGTCYCTINADGTLSYTAGGVTQSSTLKVTYNTVNHIVVGIDKAGKMTFIVNGVLDSNRAAMTIDDNSVGKLGAFKGYLDEFALYTNLDIVTPARLRKHYLTSLKKHNCFESYPCNLNAMVAWDMMTNDLYGGGVDSNRMDVEFYDRWAQRCAETVPDGKGGFITRYLFDGIFDTSQPLWDAVAAVGHSGGAMLLRNGINYTGIMDAPSDAKQLFNVANIIKGSFTESWSNADDRPNTIDIDFWDADNNYEKSTLTVQLDEVNDGKPVLQAAGVELRGCTNAARAWHYGNFALKSGKELIRTCEFESPIESIAVKPGQSIIVQHDLPEWSEGGKCEAGSAATIVNIDKEVTMETGKSYQLMVVLTKLPLLLGTVAAVSNNTVYFNQTLQDTDNAARFVDDVIDREIIHSGAGWVQLSDTSSISVGDSFTIYALNYNCVRDVTSVNGKQVSLSSALPAAPQQYDNYAFGEATKVGQQFHIIGMSRRKDLTATVQCLEYSDAVYVDGTPNINVTSRESVDALAVTDLIGNEMIPPNGLNPTVSVSWTQPKAVFGVHIYVSKNSGPEVMVEELRGPTSYTFPVRTGDAILVRVVGYDIHGNTAPYATAPTWSHDVQGGTVAPPRVTGFRITALDRTAGTMSLTWDASPDPTVEKYSLVWVPDPADILSGRYEQIALDVKTVYVPNHSTTIAGSEWKGDGVYTIRAVNNRTYVSTDVASVTVNAQTVPSYNDGTPVDALRPAQAGADVTSQNTSFDTSKVNGTAATTVVDGVNRSLAGFDANGYIDFSRSHTNKTLDHIDDTSSYVRTTVVASDVILKGYPITNSNLFLNASFENGLGYWRNDGNAVVATGNTHSGTQCARVNPIPGGYGFGQTDDSGQVYKGRRIRCKPGDQFYQEAWTYNEGTTGNAGVYTEWYDANGNYLSAAQSVTGVLGSWVKTSQVITAPTDAAYAAPCACAVFSTDSYVRVDDVVFKKLNVTGDLADLAVTAAKRVTGAIAQDSPENRLWNNWFAGNNGATVGVSDGQPSAPTGYATWASIYDMAPTWSYGVVILDYATSSMNTIYQNIQKQYVGVPGEDVTLTVQAKWGSATQPNGNLYLSIQGYSSTTTPTGSERVLTVPASALSNSDWTTLVLQATLPTDGTNVTYWRVSFKSDSTNAGLYIRRPMLSRATDASRWTSTVPRDPMTTTTAASGGGGDITGGSNCKLSNTCVPYGQYGY